MKEIRELFFNFANNAINTYKGSNSEGAEAQGKAASAKVTHLVEVLPDGTEYVKLSIAKMKDGRRVVYAK